MSSYLVKRLRALVDFTTFEPVMVLGAMRQAADRIEALEGEVLAAEKRNMEGAVNALGWMRLSDALKAIIWKHPDAAKEMMAANLPPLPIPDDAVKLVAERDAAIARAERLRVALEDVADRMNCRGEPDLDHFCPKCDN